MRRFSITFYVISYYNRVLPLYLVLLLERRVYCVGEGKATSAVAHPIPVPISIAWKFSRVLIYTVPLSSHCCYRR